MELIILYINMVERISSSNLIAQQRYFNNSQNGTINNCVQVNQLPETDTIELSVKQKIQNQVSNLSTLQKIGIASVALLGVVSAALIRNGNYISRSQKIFQNAFLKDFSREETINLLNKFKEISKIKDNKQYITELFNLGQKEYGLEKLNIKLKFEELPKGKIGCMNPLLELTVDKKAKRRNLINIIFHELKHAKQNEMMYSIDPGRFIRTILSRKSIQDSIKKTSLYQQLIKQDIPNGLSFEKYEQLVFRTILNKYFPKTFFEKLGYGQTNVKSINKQYVEKLFKANEQYNDSNWIKYYFNFLEKDARKAGEGISEINRYFPNHLK